MSMVELEEIGLHYHTTKEGLPTMYSHSPVDLSSSRRHRSGRWLKRTVVGLAALSALYGSLYLLPRTEREVKPYFEGLETPYTLAHQGGNDLYPSESLIAFEAAAAMGVEVLEYDIHITKDGELVLIHDPEVNRTTDGEGLVSEMTAQELQALDAAYTFNDLNGEHSYRGTGVRIPKVEEVFMKFSDLRHNIEIKDTNPEDSIETISTALLELISKYGMEDRVLVNSFDQEIVETFDRLAEGRIATGAGRSEVTRFVLFNKFFLGPLYRPKADVVQIPVSSSGFNLKDRRLIEAAHRLNMHVNYWTIDDEATMRELIELGADGIITDRPDLMTAIADR